MKKQEGVVMILALVILFMVSMLSMSSTNIVMGNMKVVQNFEARSAARGAAVSGIQNALTSNNFFGQTHNYTTGTIDVEVSQPLCMAAKPIHEAAQDIVDHDLKQQVCYQPGTVALCSYGQWQVTSTAYDQITGAKYVFKQTLKTTTETSLIASACGPSDVVTEL